ncbi:DUF1592 domain-containing protein [Sorangium atrum]|uniref:DUF1592 domain-containing protein n=1 Tax=Sorangium atrum TaxID=2995308 RepID=A0ABT5BS85_9BACT|nr:DUF1592 domain-containing protein [Sorangium aterium]MDC0677029.1 DUF1592 domain-containing protein [Sorangium aterium]
MTASEYNSTVAHLLGTSLRPADGFPAFGAKGFDANVNALSNLSQVLVQGYYDAARTLAEDAFSHEEQRAKILVCDPAEGTDDRCAREIIERFGLRAFRRPLEAAEVDRYAAQYDDARTTLEMSPVEAVQHVVRTVLTSPHFILRIELGPDSARSPGALNGYEVASRLSYLLWSSLPDEELFDAAASDELATAGELEQQVDRMLDDPKSAAFFQNFFGQWLGTRTLPSHNADTSQFPSWNDEMKGAMLDQVNEYFASFTTGGRPWSEFLTAPHPESRLIEPLYANDPEGLREGFLTLPAFLTLSSRADRTSPTSRAKTILEQLFCAPMAPPANVDIPELGAADGETGGVTNVRKELEKHRASPDCAGCHDVLDPIGLSLENFDPIGAYRTQYPNGDPIDATGVYEGAPFEDISGLVPALVEAARSGTCPSEQLFSYALRRRPSAGDRTRIKEIAGHWAGGTIADLAKQVVTSDAFRLRAKDKAR